MHLNRFDLNLLIALDALLKEKNVTRAAERLYVSQPAMSAALQKLRDYFNDSLLIRIGREMELTPRGLSLIEPVREALLSIQVTLGTQPTFDLATVKRNFTVMVLDYIVPRIVPQVLRRIMQEAPGVQCSFEQISLNSLSRIEYGDADLCLMIHYPALFGLAEYPDSVRIVELATTRWLCVVSKDHPTVADELTEEQFLTLPHLIGRPYEHTAPIEELARQFSQDKLDVRSTAQSLLDLPYMLIGTPLIATVPESVAVRLASVLPIKIFPPPHPVTDSREILLWHRRNESDPGHAWLRGLFIEAAKQM